MISISSSTASLTGSVVIKSNYTIKVGTSAAPVQKIRTLDGGEIVLYNGELTQTGSEIHTQKTLNINCRASKAQEQQLQGFIDSGDQFLVVSGSSYHKIYFTSLSKQRGEISITATIQ